MNVAPVPTVGSTKTVIAATATAAPDTDTDTTLETEMAHILRHVSRVFGLRTSILDAQFNEIAPLTDHPICSYCAVVQREVGLLHRCKKNDRDQCLRAKEKGTVHAYNCHAGLSEAVYPLVVDGVCVGYIIIG